MQQTIFPWGMIANGHKKYRIIFTYTISFYRCFYNEFSLQQKHTIHWQPRPPPIPLSAQPITIPLLLHSVLRALVISFLSQNNLSLITSFPTTFLSFFLYTVCFKLTTTVHYNEDITTCMFYIYVPLLCLIGK